MSRKRPSSPLPKEYRSRKRPYPSILRIRKSPLLGDANIKKAPVFNVNEFGQISSNLEYVNLHFKQCKCQGNALSISRRAQLMSRKHQSLLQGVLPPPPNTKECIS
ncbi:hypothetical protein BaRGS_00005990 [Batillaria attramentaria]|uniref:Uncharacterized protein n=1 Tax=Batillaria attramentaria TaxID=370345 RepID=A0ABD0LTQ0_9CAEN